MELNMIMELVKFLIYSLLIVLIAKYLLVRILRNLAQILNLKPKVVGNIAGVATSIPELLTVSFSALTGLIDASIFNVLSSNIINFGQYLLSIFINRNQTRLKNNAIKTDLILVFLTILIPIFIIGFKIESNTILVPVFIIFFYLFHKISHNAHKVYLKPNKKEEEAPQKKSVLVNIVGLIIASVLLYFIGNMLGQTLEVLCEKLNVPEFFMGVLLGVITSIPEFITFIESQRHYKEKENHEGVVEATSNLLFSNLMNLFIIQSIGILIYMFVSAWAK